MGDAGQMPIPSTPLPGLLGQGGLQQLQDTAHQVQAACDQHVNGSSLLEYHGPTVCHRVGEEAPWGTGHLLCFRPVCSSCCGLPGPWMGKSRWSPDVNVCVGRGA